LGLLIGIAGVAALVGLDFGRGDIGTLLAMLVVAIGYAIGPFILARHLSEAPALGVVAASLLITAVLYAVPAGFQLPRQWPPARAVLAVAVLAVICTVLAFLLFFKLIEEVGSTRATVITYINPAVAIGLGVLFLHEPFTTGIVIGFALVLLGSALATRRSRPAGARVPPPAVAGAEPLDEATAAAP